MFLEHLASDNGADMHKYDTLYTRTLSWHVLPHQHHTIVSKCKTQYKHIWHIYAVLS